MNYDLLIIGDDRKGIERAINAALDGRRVAIIEKPGAAPSLEVLQQAANRLAQSRTVTMSAWRALVDRIVRCQKTADRAEMECLGIELICGDVRFISSTAVEVTSDGETRMISGAEIVLACGTTSRLPGSFHDDGRFVMGVESLLNLEAIPQSIIVVGASATGMKAAILLARLGVEVTVVDEHPNMFHLFGLLDESFDSIQSLNIAFRLGEEVIGTELRPDFQAAARLVSGRVLTADVILVCVGREGSTAGLDLEAAGVGLDERGCVWCDAEGKTWNSYIVAIGDLAAVRRQSIRFSTDHASTEASPINWNRPRSVATIG